MSKSEENASVEELMVLLTQARADFAVAREKISFLNSLIKEKKKANYKKTSVKYEEGRYRRYFMREYLGMSFAEIGRHEGCSSAAAQNAYEKMARRKRAFENRQKLDVDTNYGIRDKDIRKISEILESIES